MYLVNILDRNANLIGNLQVPASTGDRSMPRSVAPVPRASTVPSVHHSTLLKAYRFGADAAETTVWAVLGVAGFCALACAAISWFVA